MDKHPVHSQHQTTVVLLILIIFFLIGKEINLLIENVIVCIKQAQCNIKLIQHSVKTLALAVSIVECLKLCTALYSFVVAFYLVVMPCN